MGWQDAPEVTEPAWMSAPEVDADPVQKGTTAAPIGLRGGKVDALLTGNRDPWDAGAQMLPAGLAWLTSAGGNLDNPVSRFFDSEAQRVNQMVQGNEAEYQQARTAQGREGVDAMRMLGNVVSPANLVAGTRAAQALHGFPTLAKVAASVPVGAAMGLMQPALDPDQSFWGTKGEQAKAGAIVGPIAQALAPVVGKVMDPATKEAKKLLAEGVKLTPGQMLGDRAKRLEDSLTSIPFFGDSIKKAQTRSIESFNVAAANRALSPIGQTLPKKVPAGHEANAFVRKALGDAYEEVLPRLTFTPDRRFQAELGRVWQTVGTLPKQQQEQFDKIVLAEIQNKASGGQLTGEMFKAVESQLSRQAKGFLSSADFNDRQLGSAIGDSLAAMRRGLIRSNPKDADRLQAINKGYANYTRMRRAGSSVAAADGVFTPAQLHNAVKVGDSTVGKRAFSEGDALMQDLSGAAKNVLPQKLPDSGTPYRGLLALGGGHLLNPYISAGLATGAAAYSQPGQYLLRALLAGAPEQRNALAQAVTKFGPPGALPGVLPLLEIGQQ